MNSFDFYGFNRNKIGELLGVDLYDSSIERNAGIKNNIEAWLIPYTSRDSITLVVAAKLIVGVNPQSMNVTGKEYEIEGYKDSLWDAVDNGRLSAKDILHYDNYDHDRRDCTLVRKEVEEWVQEHEFNWPLPLQQTKTKEQYVPLQSYLDKWGEFPGKGTALMFIAGLSVALEKTGGRYVRGERMNRSAIARAAINAINEHGAGTTITEKALTNLIDEALSANVTKLEE